MSQRNEGKNQQESMQRLNINPCSDLNQKWGNESVHGIKMNQNET